MLAKSSLSSWHHILGHPSNKVLTSLSQENNVATNSIYDFHCPSCLINKSHKLPFSHNSLFSNHPLELLYTDVWSTSKKSIEGHYYYAIFVDHFTRYVWLYPMKKKSNVYTMFIQFKKLVKKRLNRKIITVFSDNGGEFQKLIPFFTSCGISHHLTTPPHTPKHNGVAKHRHRQIVETGLTLLHFASMPRKYWSYSFQTAIYLINHMPTSILKNISPLQALFQMVPN